MATFNEKQIMDRLWQAFTTDGSGNPCLRIQAAGALPADSVKDSMIDWGTGADQVSAVDMPIADAGGYFPTDNVEAALQQLAADIAAGGAPASATYIVQTPSANLSNEQALSALATGILKSTTTTGVVSIAVEGTDYYAPGGTNVAIADGGTNANDAAGARTNLGLAIGSDVQAWDADLDALAALAATAGMLSRTGAGAFAARTLTAPAAGITISNPTGSGGNPTFALADDLSAVEGLASTGIAARTAASTWAVRTITGTSNRITLSNGDGVSGNPTIDIAATYVGQTSITTLGTITTGTWTGTSIAVANGGTGSTTASGARTNLGAAASGTNGDITSLSAIAAAAGIVFNPYGSSAGNTSELRFLELAANGSNYVGFQASDSIASSVIWTLPSTAGSSGQALLRSTGNTLVWGAAGSNTIFLHAKDGNPTGVNGCAAATYSDVSSISPDATSFGTGVGTTRTVSHTIGSGSNGILLVGAHYANGTTISTSCTFNGVAMTKATFINGSPTGETQEMWYMLNPPAGTYDIVLTISSSKNMQVLGSSYFGVQQSSQPDATSTGNTGTTSISPSVTTVARNAWIMCYAKNNGATYTAGANTVLRRDGSASGFLDSGTGRTTTGSNTITATSASASHGWVVVSIKPLLEFGIVTLDFDASTEEYAVFQTILPSNYSGGTVTAKFHWMSLTATSGDVIWGIQGAAFADGDLMPGAGYGTAQEVTDTCTNVAKKFVSSATSAITLAGSPAAGQMAHFKVYRKAAAAGDTMTGDARLLGVELTF